MPFSRIEAESVSCSRNAPRHCPAIAQALRLLSSSALLSCAMGIDCLQGQAGGPYIEFHLHRDLYRCSVNF
jgi:hypothetical protein